MTVTVTIVQDEIQGPTVLKNIKLRKKTSIIFLTLDPQDPTSQLGPVGTKILFLADRRKSRMSQIQM